MDKIKILRKWIRKTIFIFIPLYFFLSTKIFSDFFKWEVIFQPSGSNKKNQVFSILYEGKLKLNDERFDCNVSDFWTKIESELLLEGKTLNCKSQNARNSVSLVCRDNHRLRLFNSIKEIYLEESTLLVILPLLGEKSPKLELRCYF